MFKCPGHHQGLIHQNHLRHLVGKRSFLSQPVCSGCGMKKVESVTAARTIRNRTMWLARVMSNLEACRFDQV